MLKTKSGAYFNLPTLLLLGLFSCFLFLVFDVHLATGQIRTYFCQSSPGSHRVMVSSRQDRPLIIWNRSQQNTCTDVANRFQSAYTAGNLRFLFKIGNDICGSRTERESTRCPAGVLVSLDGVTQESLLVRIFNGREVVPGSYIFQNSDSTRFSWEQYLEGLEKYPLREPVNLQPLESPRMEQIDPRSPENPERRPVNPRFLENR